MSPISSFGWTDFGGLDMNSANLEAEHAAVGAYADRKWPTNSTTPEEWGAKADLIEFSDGAITSGTTTLTSASIVSNMLPGGAGSKNFYIVWGGAGTAAGSPSSILSTGGAITSIPRTAGAAVPAGPVLIEDAAGHSQFFWTSGAALNASIPVASQTPNFAYPTSSTITFGATGLSGTVQAVTSGSMTLSASSSHTLSGITGWFGTDDTAAIQAALNTGLPVILGTNKNYLADGALQTANQGYSVLQFPPGTGRPVGLHGHGSDIYTTRLGDAYSGTFGVPSVLGGPTYEQQPSAWSIAADAHIDGLRVRLPDNPSICGIDLSRCIGATVGTTYPVTVESAIEPGAPYGAESQTRTHAHACGIRLPYTSNGGRVVVGRIEASYMYAGISPSEHASIHDYLSFNNYVSIAFDDRSAAGAGHANAILYFDSEGCAYHIAGWRPDTGVQSLGVGNTYWLSVFEMDIEEQYWQNATIYHILDANNQIIGNGAGGVYYRWALGGPQTAGWLRSGGQKFKVRNVDPSQSLADGWTQVFTSNGTWTKPPGAQTVTVTVVGGGGGGQSGATAAGGVAIAGGGGGQAGGLSVATFNASDLSQTVTVTVGAGGAGGTGISASNTPGAWSGKTGGNSSFGTYLLAGGGGESAQGPTSTGGLGATQSGALGGIAAAGGNGGQGANGLAGSGGAGGGVTTGSAFQAGGPGGAAARDAANAGSGITLGAVGSNGSATPATNIAVGGGGGGGGAGGDATANGGAGGNGGNYGGGGGGGGGTINTKTSGAGGTGGNGIVVVTCT